MSLHAWAAGFIEGEGHLGLKTIHGGRSFAPRITASQVERPPIDRLNGLYGGSVWLQQRTGKARENQRPIWMWELSGRDNVRAALVHMQPWLLVKAAQAELVIEFIDQMRPSRGRPRLTDAEVLQRQAIAARLKDLTRRGMAVQECGL